MESKLINEIEILKEELRYAKFAMKCLAEDNQRLRQLVLDAADSMKYSKESK
jgi:hypothetical protein